MIQTQMASDEWLTLLENTNAYRRGIFASRKIGANKILLPFPPNANNKTERIFWHMGVHDGSS